MKKQKEFKRIYIYNHTLSWKLNNKIRRKKEICRRFLNNEYLRESKRILKQKSHQLRKEREGKRTKIEEKRQSKEKGWGVVSTKQKETRVY